MPTLQWVRAIWWQGVRPLCGTYGSLADPCLIIASSGLSHCLPLCVDHTHIAAVLDVPLVTAYSFPWYPTSEFTHPMVIGELPKKPSTLLKRLSYNVVEFGLWYLVRPLVNRFRRDALQAPSLSFQQLMALGGSKQTSLHLFYIWSVWVAGIPSHLRCLVVFVF